uniref:Uncharacterized protein n=2 Tax=Neisseria meningitidis TaxID=487 RepID=C6SJF1_NEIME|nr:hypothetical protein predicted by Glimmer/Critica [Neisseria meningitidis alpha153]CBA07071.1 hypothetical protein predicted by Glimmer/Critica [Neisseria meningitidis alpha275]
MSSCVLKHHCPYPEIEKKMPVLRSSFRQNAV